MHIKIKFCCFKIFVLKNIPYIFDYNELIHYINVSELSVTNQKTLEHISGTFFNAKGVRVITQG
jgi:hypothetical protein